MSQTDTIDRLAVKHGRVSVTQPYTDGSVRVTAPNGECSTVSEAGHVTKTGVDLSIDWSE